MMTFIIYKSELLKKDELKHSDSKIKCTVSMLYANNEVLALRSGQSFKYSSSL